MTYWSQSYKDLAKPSRGRGASAGPINTESVYWTKRNIVNTNKWSTGYLTPLGNKIKEELDKLSLEELQEKFKKEEIKCKDIESAINNRDELIYLKKPRIFLRLFLTNYNKSHLFVK